MQVEKFWSKFPNNRSSHRMCSIEKGVPKNFTKFTGKQLCYLFTQVADLRPVPLLKNRLWHRRCPVNFAKLLKTPFLWNSPCGCFWIYDGSIFDNSQGSKYISLFLCLNKHATFNEDERLCRCCSSLRASLKNCLIFLVLLEFSYKQFPNN